MRMPMFKNMWGVVAAGLLCVRGTEALISADKLYTDSVTYCSEAKDILVNNFDIQYHRMNQSVTFSISAAAVSNNLNVAANIYANAYGRQIVNLTINLCDYLQGVLCPLPAINFTGYGTYPIPSQYTDDIPGLAWTVPDLEAFARITLTDNTDGSVAACLSATLSNGLSTQQTAVKWASAALVIVALIVALIHSTLRWSPSAAVYRWYDVLFIFQAAAASGLLEINYPSNYVNFVLNFPWALGLFRDNKIQEAVVNLRNSTGGTLPTTAFSAVDYINRKLSPYNEAIAMNTFFAVNSTASDFRSFAALASPVDLEAAAMSLVKRADIPTISQQDTISTLKNGIPVYSNSVGIPTASAFDTIFIIYMISLAIVLGTHIVWGLIVFLGDRFRSDERRGRGWLGEQRRGFFSFFAGNMMRLCLIFLFPVFIFALYQFKLGRQDSWLSILLAALCVAWTVIGLTVVLVLAVLRHRKTGHELSMTSPLYSRYGWYNSAGMIYRQYRPRYHFWWYAPVALAAFVRACFIAFGQGNPWAQVIGLVVVEFLLLVTCIGFRPHKDKKGDWLGAFLAFCRMCGFGLMIAFIPSMGVEPITRTIIGFACIVLFGIPVVLLFFGLLFNLAYGYAFRRNKRRVEDGTEVSLRRHASDVNSTTPAMIQAGGFATPSEAADPQGMMGAGNGLRPYDAQQNAGMRQSYHPSIDGEEPGHRGEYYTYGNNRNSPYGYSEAYDGYNTGPVPQRQSAHGYAYGGSGDQPEGYGHYGGFDQEGSQVAYNNAAGIGAGQGYRNQTPSYEYRGGHREI